MPEATARAVNERVISFPEKSLGRIFIDQEDTSFMQQWPERQSGIEARGRIKVPQSASILLATSYADAHCLGRLSCLKPGSIQGLDVDGSIVTESYLKQIWAIKDLKTLVLLGTSIDNRDLSQIVEHMPHLIDLDLGYTVITDKGIACLARLRRLSTLRLRKAPITDIGISMLAQSKSLTYLDLSDTQITDAALPALCKLTKLSTLNLARTKITDNGIYSLQSISNLKRLDLSKTALTDDGLANLVSHLPNLEQLNLSDTKVSNRGIDYLTKLKHLRKLWLRSLAQVDDSVVPLLSAMSNLEDIEIQGTNIRPKGVLQLSQTLPNAEVHSKTPCACHKRTRVN